MHLSDVVDVSAKIPVQSVCQGFAGSEGLFIKNGAAVAIPEQCRRLVADDAPKCVAADRLPCVWIPEIEVEIGIEQGVENGDEGLAAAQNGPETVRLLFSVEFGTESSCGQGVVCAMEELKCFSDVTQATKRGITLRRSWMTSYVLARISATWLSEVAIVPSTVTWCVMTVKHSS